MTKRLLYVWCLLALAACAWGQSYPQCDGCKDGESTPSCPDPGACGFEPACQHCMDGHPMQGCPDPARCGRKPSCMNCQDTPSPDCPQPDVCARCVDCRDGMVTPGCPNPHPCGFEPACTDCMDGHAMPDCPDPDVCKDEPVCDDCQDGVVTPGCPLPHKCGFDPACTDCMDHPMPQCPDPDVCHHHPAHTEPCTMTMLFGWGLHTCVLFESWHVTNGAQYFGTIVAIIAICVAREWLSVYRNCAHRGGAPDFGAEDSGDAPMLGGRPVSLERRVPVGPLLFDSFLYCLNITISYLIMLIVMTYNGGLVITVLLACTAGHLAFTYAYRKRGVKPIQADHCCSEIEPDMPPL